MNILHLTLKRQWFVMTESGVKKEEYREIKPYWANRLLTNSSPHCDVWGEHGSFDEMVNDLKDPTKRHRDLEELMSFFKVKFKKFDTTRFTNGYSKTAPTFDIEQLKISIGIGNPEWGAPPEPVFIISHGNILN